MFLTDYGICGTLMLQYHKLRNNGPFSIGDDGSDNAQNTSKRLYTEGGKYYKVFNF